MAHPERRNRVTDPDPEPGKILRPLPYFGGCIQHRFLRLRCYEFVRLRIIKNAYGSRSRAGFTIGVASWSAADRTGVSSHTARVSR